MSYELYPVRTGSLIEMEYTPEATKFTLWSPTADEVRLMLYEAGEGGHAYETVKMQSGEEGTWTAVVSKDLIGKFYTFNVKIDDKGEGDIGGMIDRVVAGRYSRNKRPCCRSKREAGRHYRLAIHQSGRLGE